MCLMPRQREKCKISAACVDDLVRQNCVLFLLGQQQDEPLQVTAAGATGHFTNDEGFSAAAIGGSLGIDPLQAEGDDDSSQDGELEGDDEVSGDCNCGEAATTEDAEKDRSIVIVAKNEGFSENDITLLEQLELILRHVACNGVFTL